MQNYMTNSHVIIMAGGIGSRFWPLSTSDCPKQFIDVLGCGKTLIQLTLSRFKNFVPIENIWVVTSESYFNLVCKQLPEIPISNILLEPEKKNTAPCIAYASLKIRARDENASIIITPSDSLVIDLVSYQNILSKSLLFSERNRDAIVTVGIQPSRPETGYGYISVKKKEVLLNEIIKVSAFKEKPSIELAKRYLTSGNYYWNAGVFICNIHALLLAFKKYLPEIAISMTALQSYVNTDLEKYYIKDFYSKCKSISIDYGIIEKSDSVFVIISDFGWSDLGTWESLRINSKQDNLGNALIGSNMALNNSSENIIYVPEFNNVVINGLNRFIVAIKDNKLLICPIKDEQNISNLLK